MTNDSDKRPDDIQQMRGGDPEALNRLLARCRHRIDSLARTRLGGDLRRRLETSDIVQSTLLDVMRSVGDFAGRDEDDFVSWLGRVMENNIRDKRRYYAASKRHEEGEQVELAVADKTVAAATRSPASQAAFGEEMLLVATAMGRLTPDHRDVFNLRMVRGLDYPEVARRMGRSEVATRALLSRARATLVLELERLRRERVD